MKKLFSALVILFATASVYGQNSAERHLILSVNGGLGVPIGSYGKADYADEKSGFSKIGAHFNISAVYYLNKNFGIGVLGGYSRFGLKAQSLADGYKEDSGTDSTTLYKKGNNSSVSILAGPYYSISVSKKLSVDFRLLGGYINTHLAGFQIYYEDYLDNVMTQKESSAGSFGFQAGAGLRYKLTELISIQANADYFSSKPKFNISYDNFVVNSGRRLTTYNQSLGGVNATIGVAINLGK